MTENEDSTADIAAFENLKNNYRLCSLTLIREKYKHIDRYKQI